MVNVLCLKVVSTKQARIGVYAGSFQPFHRGHLNIVQKAALLFERVIVARGLNPAKTDPQFHWPWPPALADYETAEFSGLLTDYLKQLEQTSQVVLIRGLRNGDDLAYEVNQLRFMQQMKPDLKVIFLVCDSEFAHISSTALRNLETIHAGLAAPYLP